MKKIVVGKLSDIAEKSARTIQVGELEIALFRLSTGEIKAIENKCPHKGGKLSEGIICDHHVYCPLHDQKINLLDGLVQEPDEGCVETFKVEIDENTQEIVLHVEEKKILAS